MSLRASLIFAAVVLAAPAAAQQLNPSTPPATPDPAAPTAPAAEPSPVPAVAPAAAPTAEPAPPEVVAPALSADPVVIDAEAAPPAESDETPLEARLQLHGYGNWRSGITSGENAYLFGDEKGRFDSASFTLVEHASPWRFLRFVASQEIGVEGADEFEVELDFVFVDWTITDWFALMLGVGPFPVGLSTEVYDVGTVRPFLALPQSVYGFSGALGENLKGIQLRFDTDVGEAGNLELTVFGGAAEFEARLPFAVFAFDDDPSEEQLELLDEEELEGVPRLIGGRVLLRSAIEHLDLGVSGYAGEADESGELIAESGEEGHQVVSAFVSYSPEPFSVRLEYLYGHLEGTKLHAGYLEADYYLTAEWQLAARADLARFELEDAPGGELKSLTEHLDLALGVAYWVAPEFAVKAAYHFVVGNLYARPEAEGLYEAVQEGELDDDTHYGELGMAFSF